MKSPVVLVSAALAAAILLTVSLLIATGTRGDDTPAPPAGHAAAASITE
jgi:aldose sugar dehydrogenase